MRRDYIGREHKNFFIYSRHVSILLPQRSLYNVCVTFFERFFAMSDFFRTAYDRMRARYTDDQWLGLDPRRITYLLYQEMRRMDAEAVAAAKRAAEEAEEPQRKATA